MIILDLHGFKFRAYSVIDHRRINCLPCSLISRVAMSMAGEYEHACGGAGWQCLQELRPVTWILTSRHQGHKLVTFFEAKK